MRPLLAFIVAALVPLWLASSAIALPAPMSEDKLMQESAVAAMVRVISVTCLSVGKDAATGDPQPSYNAKLLLLEVRKGSEKPGDTVTVTFAEVPKGIVGPWAVFYYPGEEVWTYLKGTPGAYETTWWNARSQPIKNAEITQLPMTPGKTVSIERSR